MIRNIVRILSLIAFLGGLVWYYYQPGYEPFIAIFAGLANLLSWFSENGGNGQNIKSGKNSKNIQIGRDVNFNK